MLTTEEAIGVGIAAAVVLILALIFTVFCIYTAQKKFAKATEDVQKGSWVFLVDEKGVGHWYNEETMEIKFKRPGDSDPPNDKWVQVQNFDKETVGYFNKKTEHLVCEMIKGVNPVETVDLPDSFGAQLQYCKQIWQRE